MKRKGKATLSLCCLLLLFALCFHGLSGLIPFVDERQNSVWQDLYHHRDTVSVLCIGSSHVYCGINPMQIREQTGKKTVLISSGMQTLAETYYCMEEALRYQQPEVVLVDLYGAYKEFTETNYTNLDCMRLSPSKVRLAQTAFSDTRLMDALFPLIREHSNWKEFDNLKQNIERRKHPKPYEFGFSGMDTVVSEEQYQGYLKMPYDNTPLTLRKQDEEMIQKIRALGEKKGVSVEFILIPWLEEFTATVNYESFLQAITQAAGTVLVVSPEEYHRMGLSRDTFIEDKVSENQHLNLQGARLYTDYLIENVLQQEKKQ